MFRGIWECVMIDHSPRSPGHSPLQSVYSTGMSQHNTYQFLKNPLFVFPVYDSWMLINLFNLSHLSSAPQAIGFLRISPRHLSPSIVGPPLTFQHLSEGTSQTITAKTCDCQEWDLSTNTCYQLLRSWLWTRESLVLSSLSLADMLSNNHP